MEALALISRLMLALVFVVSCVAKLRDRAGAVGAMHAFGMPSPFARIGAVALPLGEAAIALLLVYPSTSWWGAWAALLLLLTFSIAIGYQLSQGRHPHCHCFGAMSGGPIGRSTVLRNGVLAIVALLPIVEGWGAGTRQLGAIARDDGAMLALLLILALGVLGAIAIQLWFSLVSYQRLSRRIGELSAEITSRKARAARRAAGEVVPPVIGEPAPIVELPDMRGNLVDLATRTGRELRLVFVRPDCGSCLGLLPALRTLGTNAEASGTHTLVISRGTAEENRDFAGLSCEVLLCPDASVGQAFGISVTPSVLAIDADGNIATEVVSGTHLVRQVLDPTPASAGVEAAEDAATRWHDLPSLLHRALAGIREAGT